jgi:predicted DCC family thiol-disulfide oxidoreductase YuxK
MDSPGPSRPTLVFDGDCAFCTSSATWFAERLRRRDRPDATLVPWQFTDLAAIGTSPERAQREVLWLASDGSLSGGAEAFSCWLRYAGGAWGALGRLMTLPLIRQLAAAVYRVIARNRQRMPGGSPACALPPAGYEPSKPGTQTLQRRERQPADQRRSEVDVEDRHGEDVETQPEHRRAEQRTATKPEHDR